MTIICRVLGAVFICVWLILGTATAQDAYLVNSGDELVVDILEDQEEPQQYTVGSEGAIQLPLIGGVRVVNEPLAEVRELIRGTYMSREIYVDPTVEVSISAYRPIFVLGDVKNPGFHNFQPFLTSEQAMGLAGGPVLDTNNEEARVLERRALDGSLSTVQTEIARLGTEYARLQAQMRGDPEVKWEDVPAGVRRVIDRVDFDELVPNEQRILSLEQTNFITQMSLLRESIVEAQREIDLLGERADHQQTAIDTGQRELALSKELVEKGLQAESVRSQLERLVSDEEAQLLQLRAQNSAAKRKLGELRRELSRIDSDRRQRLLSESQVGWAEISKNLTNRSSMIDRLGLLDQWMNARLTADSGHRIEFRIRRRSSNGKENLVVDRFEELLPGDLLVVVVKPPEALAELNNDG